MLSPQKQVSTHKFEYVNTDTARELLGANEAVFMLNCITLSTAQGSVGVVTNLKGNTLIEKELHEGRNRTIGWATDEEVNKFYYFVWNENGYHTVYRYDGLLNRIDVVFQSITDTGGVDILRWKEEDLITMADVVRNTQLYWVKRGNDAAKINIEKAMDKSDNGYGFISEDIINAYKLAPAVAPVNTYASDTSIDINNFYGTLIRTTARFRYDDGEESNYSDFSNVATPEFEAFTGVNFIPTENNRIDIKVPTGSRIVTDIEIAMQYTIEGGLSPWVQIVRLNKKRLGIGDNSEYTYSFYNENRGQYPVVDQEKVIRPYSYLPDFPLVQAFAENSMIYGNFKEGFPTVELDVELDTVDYTPLFLDDAEEPVLNDANILVENLDGDYIGYPSKVTYLDGNFDFVPYTIRANKFKMTIGSDVKKGNKFSVRLYNGYDDYNFSYTATITDTASSVANKFKQLLIGTGKLLRDTPDMTPVNIYDTDTTGGNASFEFIIYTSKNKSYYNTVFNAEDVNTSTLKDTGQSVGNAKLGASRKYGIVYGDGRKVSLAYTDVNWIVPTATANELDGIQKVSVVLSINHKPPVWAKTFEIVRTAVNTEFIQLLIQNVIDVQSTVGDTGEYLDLLVGSLYTYQKIHPNTTLKYQFKKGDRLRLLTNEEGDYYDFFETEILSYNDSVTTDVNENVTIDGTDKITVVDASEDNIGKFIIVNGIEREIIGVDDSTHYLVNSPIGSEEATFLSYTLVDRRGSIRVRKPSEESVPGGIEDQSMVEIFSPQVVQQEGEPFYHFNKKFNIIDAGTETRQHFGDIQSQTDSQPAKISVSEAEIYVRQREMPITNTTPAQVVIRTVEDPAYSDYYFSVINSNGRRNAEDTGIGVVDFGDRLRASNNYIEDTKINGLNDFDNLDRKDYNDKYGAFKRLVYTEGQLLAFKELKVGIIPIYQKIIEDNAGLEVLGTSNDLLNPIRYYSHEGGINNNPEAYARNESWHYYADVNKGQIIRLAGDGATPVSEIYNLDSYVREVLSQAYRNGGQVFLEWDVDHSMLIVSVTDYNNYSFNSTFNEANWQVLNDTPPADTPVELLTAPEHATATLDGTILTINIDDYTGEDSMSYRAFIDGQWVNRNICLDIKQLSNRQTAWRARTSDAVCVTEEGIENGMQMFITLEQFWTDTGELTGETKPNTEGQPDYVAPIQNLEACPFEGTVYYSVEKSGVATKNNCPAGQTGSTETYTVEAGAYDSIVSQEAADTKAQNDVNANKQAYANSVGTCTPTASFGNDERTAYYTKNDCGGGLFGSSVPITVAANTYYASTKAAANATRDAYISANGQSNANTLGTCSAMSSFTLEVVIYPDYKGGGYSSADSRGVSMALFRDGLTGSPFYSFLVSTTITNNSVVHTYSIPFSGSSVEVTLLRLYLRFSATSVGGSAKETIYKNGVFQGDLTHTITGGQPSGTEYMVSLVPAGTTILTASDVLRITHGTPPSTTYYSAAADFPATKNNCPAGAIGSTETLSLPYGLYTSTISQSDADAQATTYGNANKQAYANTNGSCAYGNDETSQAFITQNCPDGFTGGEVIYTVPANTYLAPTKAEANEDADADVADNGQDYANDNPNCIEIEYPDFTFLTPWAFTDTGALNTATTRSYNEGSMPTGALWVVRNSGYGLRINWEDSMNCEGTNNKVQSGTASVSINVAVAQNINIIWSGLAELQDTGYENMELKIDGVLIGKATSAGGNQGCVMGDVISTNYYPSGYPLTVGTHTISITSTTSDALYHVDSYYDFVLTKVV